MFNAGTVLVIIFYDEKKNSLSEPPYIFTYGFINMKKNEMLINNWKNKIDEYLKKEEKSANWEKKIEDYIEKELLGDWNKDKPLIHTIVEYK